MICLIIFLFLVFLFFFIIEQGEKIYSYDWINKEMNPRLEKLLTRIVTLLSPKTNAKIMVNGPKESSLSMAFSNVGIRFS